MSDLEKYINSEDEIDPLIKIGLVHYQFETIHPFLDGNGRIGRMIITLWLILKDLLKNPVLYISYFFKRNRVEYYDRLMDVRLKGHFEEWIRFFLNGIIESAEDACETIKLMRIIAAIILFLFSGLFSNSISINLSFMVPIRMLSFQG